MYAVIFKAKVKQLDKEYASTAERMYELAFKEYGCVNFSDASENGQEIAISYWNSLDDIKRWKANSEHQSAQKLGQEKWYESYEVEVVEIKRSYKSY